MDYKISVIIRTYNEQKHIKDVLDGLVKQTYKNFEIIIVDSESTDETLNIARSYPIKLVNIKKSRFNYSYASNIGASHAEGDILCFLSGHSVPVNNDYLYTLNQVFNIENVYGCYGDCIPYKDAGIAEGLYYKLGYIKNKIFNNKNVIEKKIHPGILSCSNAAVLRKFWVNNQFIEELGAGGEDVYMAHMILKENHMIIKSNNLLVKHSHGKGFKKFKQELKNWGKLYQDALREINKIDGNQCDL